MLCFCIFLAILGHFGTNPFRKPVAPVAYKNKLTVNRRRHLAGVLWPLTCRCALFPNASDVSVSYMQPGLRRQVSQLTFNILTNWIIWFQTIGTAKNHFISVPFLFNCQGYREAFFILCTLLFKFQGHRRIFLSSVPIKASRLKIVSHLRGV